MFNTLYVIEDTIQQFMMQAFQTPYYTKYNTYIPTSYSPHCSTLSCVLLNRAHILTPYNGIIPTL